MQKSGEKERRNIRAASSDDHRPLWMRIPRNKRSPALSADHLLKHLRAIFLQHYPGTTDATWNWIMEAQQGDRSGHADALAKHLLAGERNSRPLDPSDLEMVFYSNFSVALQCALEAAWTSANGRPALATSLLGDGWYLAGLCTVQADFKDPKATTARNLEVARKKKKDAALKELVFKWCVENQQRFSGSSNSVLAEALYEANVAPKKAFTTIYGWVCQWAREQRTKDN